MNATAEMRTNGPEKCFGKDAVTNEMLLHDVYEIPREDTGLVVCPYCEEVGESMDLLLHERWCPMGDWAIRPGDF